MDDRPNGRDVPNGGVVDGEEEKTRRTKVANVHQQQREGDGGRVSSLLTKQLDALENDDAEPGTTAEHNSLHHPPEKVPTNSSSKEEDAAELAAIARDLRKIKRQNTITHVLLGAVIVMTAAWQINEVSFLLWVQRKLSNPFKSLGDLVKGSLKLKGRGRPAVIESSPLPLVGVPDVARADLPTLVIGGGDGR